MSKILRQFGLVTMPDFSGTKVHVLQGAFYSSCVGLFAEAGFEKANTVEEADVVLFIGGVDVDPALYNEKRIGYTERPNLFRDQREVEAFNHCLENRKPMIGICRGAQFLHVMNGGKLWQHVDGHAGPDHNIIDLLEDVEVRVTSYHHQMLRENEGMEVVAVASKDISTVFMSDGFSIRRLEGITTDNLLEIEAGAYSKSRCFFVQGHPEVGSPEYRSWFMHKVHDYLYEFMDAFKEKKKSA